MKKQFLISFFMAILFTGCFRDIPTPTERKSNLLSLVENKNYQVQIINTSNFNLFSIQDIQNNCKNIKVYIEGDGLAWKTRSVISNNPTPLNPTALKLMNVDKYQCKIYIARPCQYTNSLKKCEKKYWTSHRFNSKVINSYIEALNKLKAEYKNNTFSIIGYSGGASVALLTASKRNDISKIITVAGNMDHTFWTEYHKITPLSDSLNPIDYIKELSHIPQYHLIGSNDKIIPKDIFNSYISYFEDTSNIQSKIYPATHTKNWEQNYKDFLKEINKNEK